MATRIEVVELPLSELRLCPWNPRKMSQAQRAKLRASIEEFGLVDPLVVDETNMVLGGNQRLIVLREMGVPKALCVRVYGLTEQQKRALNIALNRISGEWDTEILAKLLDEMPVELREVTGFTPTEIEKLILQWVEEFEAVPGKPLEVPPWHADYIVLVFEDKVEWERLIETLGLDRVKIKTKGGTYLGRVRIVKGDEFIRKICGGE